MTDAKCPELWKLAIGAWQLLDFVEPDHPITEKLREFISANWEEGVESGQIDVKADRGGSK
jgi:hypothetical protein